MNGDGCGARRTGVIHLKHRDIDGVSYLLSQAPGCIGGNSRDGGIDYCCSNRLEIVRSTFICLKGQTLGTESEGRD